MTSQELYDALNRAGLDFELMQIFEGVRWLAFEVDEVNEED